MGFIDKLKKRWNLDSASRVLIVLIVFALTGTTVLLIKRPILDAINPTPENKWIYDLVYYILILPFYNIILLIYGFLFGQFQFLMASKILIMMTSIITTPLKIW